MKFIIPDGGKMLSIGNKLVSFKSGEIEITDEQTIKALKNAKGVTQPKAKAKAKE